MLKTFWNKARLKVNNYRKLALPVIFWRSKGETFIHKLTFQRQILTELSRLPQKLHPGLTFLTEYINSIKIPISIHALQWFHFNTKFQFLEKILLNKTSSFYFITFFMMFFLNYIQSNFQYRIPQVLNNSFIVNLFRDFSVYVLVISSSTCFRKKSDFDKNPHLIFFSFWWSFASKNSFQNFQPFV